MDAEVTILNLSANINILLSLGSDIECSSMGSDNCFSVTMEENLHIWLHDI